MHKHKMKRPFPLWLLILPISLILLGTLSYLLIERTTRKEVPIISAEQVFPSEGESSMSTQDPTETASNEPIESFPTQTESESIPSEEVVQNSETPSEPVVQIQSDSLRVDYAEGFFYEPISEEIKARINGLSYKEDCTVPYEDLRYMQVLHIDFNNETQVGELICNKGVAQDFIEIFEELYRAGYQIEKIRLIDEYNADDKLSMTDNNTSAFNFRLVSGTTHLSKHAYGAAIDINPFYNPYCESNGYISPPGSEPYADRTVQFDHKIDENDLCYQLFTEHGFTWGGSWNSVKDYQHFQKELPGY